MAAPVVGDDVELVDVRDQPVEPALPLDSAVHEDDGTGTVSQSRRLRSTKQTQSTATKPCSVWTSGFTSSDRIQSRPPAASWPALHQQVDEP